MQSLRKSLQGLLGDRAVGDLVVYVLLQGLQTAITLLFMMLYARRMAPSEYGSIATYTSVSSLCGVILYLSVREKAYFALLAAESESQLIVSTVLRFIIAAALLIVPFAMLITWTLHGRFLAGLPLFPHVFLAQLSAAGGVLVSMLALSFQAKEKMGKGAIVNFAAFAFFAALNISLLFIVGMSSLSYVYAHSIAYAICGIVATVLLFNRYGKRFSLPHLRGALRFSIPLIPHHIAHWARASADRVIISSALSTAATGIYGMAAAYCNVAVLVAEVFGFIYTARFFRLAADPATNGARICSILPVAVGIAALVATLMSLSSHAIFHLIASPDYWYASKYVPLLSMSLPLYTMYANVVPVLMYRQRTGLVSAITASSSLLAVAVTVVSIHFIGAWAAAIGVVLLYACLAFIVIAFAQRELKLPWSWRSTVVPCVLPALGYLTNRDASTPWIFVILLSVVAIVYIGLTIRVHVRLLLGLDATLALAAKR